MNVKNPAEKMNMLLVLNFDFNLEPNHFVFVLDPKSMKLTPDKSRWILELYPRDISDYRSKFSIFKFKKSKEQIIKETPQNRTVKTECFEVFDKGSLSAYMGFAFIYPEYGTDLKEGIKKSNILGKKMIEAMNNKTFEKTTEKGLQEENIKLKKQISSRDDYVNINDISEVLSNATGFPVKSDLDTEK